ncbi:PREDICTED: protein NEDD1-like isoform X3 [Branchiostoma belcheri]|uniref:Protein NEDD1-like isoform X3 n=1 Tax=Branchiostoma belcheri TaxID=7741 RepID=A0A6P4YY45_BRABE|nr:PREDICTED: protein NEDD1-like isoform X3 [Branchiostoma belcheri]
MADSPWLVSVGGDAKVWEVPSMAMVSEFNPHQQDISSACWSHNNQFMATASTAGDKVVLTSVKRGAAHNIAEYAVGESQTCVAFHSTSRYLLTGGKDGTIHIFDIKTKKVKKQYKGHSDAITCVTFNWNDTYIASGSVNGNIVLHNVTTNQASSPLSLPKMEAIRDIQYSYFKRSLLGSVSDSGTVVLWDTNTRRPLHSFKDAHHAPATALTFSPVNDMLMATVGLDKKICCYDVQGKSIVRTMTAESPLTAVDLMYDGATLVVGSTRGKVYLYDLRAGTTPQKVTQAHKTSVKCLKFKFQMAQKAETGRSASQSSTKKSVQKSTSHPNIRSGSARARAEARPPKGIPQSASTGSISDQDKQAVRVPSKDNLQSEEIFSPIRDASSGTGDASNQPRPQLEGKADIKADPGNNGIGVFSPLGDNMTTPVAAVRRHPIGSVDTPEGASFLSRPMAGGESSESEPDARFSAPKPSFVSQIPTLPSNLTTSTSSDSEPALGMRPAASGALSSRRPTSPGEAKIAERAGVPITNPAMQSAHQSVAQPVPQPSIPPSLANSPSDPDLKGAAAPPLPPPSAPAPGLGITTLPGSPARRVGSPAPGSPDVRAKVGLLGGASSSMNSVQSPESEDEVGDRVKRRVDASAAHYGLQPFQIEFIKNLVEDAMDECRLAMHTDIVNLQVEMLRQFQIQKSEVNTLLQRYSVNESLVSEIERLREENRRLKTYH